MSPLHLLLSLSLSLSLVAGCGQEQGDTGSDGTKSDEVCEQSTIDITETGAVALEFDDSGIGTYDGSVDVTLFSRTEMRVETEEIIVSIPKGKIASIDVTADDTFDLFTGMVFTLDIRKPGTTEWQDFTYNTGANKVFWFTQVELNQALSKGAISTLRVCSTLSDHDNLALPASFWELDDGYEMRLRAFPFEGWGDLVGTYGYEVRVALQ